MTKKIFLKSIVVVICLLLQFACNDGRSGIKASTKNEHEETLQATVHVETAGTLVSLIRGIHKYEITDLTLTGNLDSRDIRYIREMAGHDVQGKDTGGKLRKLNLSGANIVSYGQTGSVRRNDHGSPVIADIDPTCYYLWRFNSSQRAFEDIWTYYYYHTVKNSISEKMFSGGYRSSYPYSLRLNTIILPNSVITIGNYAFERSLLTSITIPNSVISVGASAFYSNRALKTVSIGNSVIEIGKSTFADCVNLTEIYSKNPVPPIATSSSFSGVDKTICKVYEPKGSKEKYWYAPGWTDFHHIIEK